MRISVNPTVVAVAFAAAATAISMSPAAAAGRHVVEIAKFKFVPAKLQVAPGDTIVWINKDIVPHTVTSAGKSWDSGTINKSGKWQIVVRSDMPGTYFCRFHPAMKAQFSIAQ